MEMSSDGYATCPRIFLMPYERAKLEDVKGPPKCGAVLDLGEGVWIFNELILSIFNFNILAYFSYFSKNASEMI